MGYEAREIYPRADLFSDEARCAPAALVDALRFVAAVVQQNGRALDALPLLAALEYIVAERVRDADAVISCRLQRVIALLDVGDISGALSLLFLLFRGKQLPGWIIENSGDPSNAPPRYANCSAPHTPTNLAVIRALMDEEIKEDVAELYGAAQVLMLQLTRAQAIARLSSLENLAASSGSKVLETDDPEKPVSASIDFFATMVDTEEVARRFCSSHTDLLQFVDEGAAGISRDVLAMARVRQSADANESPSAGIISSCEADTENEGAEINSTEKEDSTAQSLPEEVETKLVCEALKLRAEVALGMGDTRTSITHARSALEFCSSRGDITEESEKSYSFFLAPAWWLSCRLLIAEALRQQGLISDALEEIKLASKDAMNV